MLYLFTQVLDQIIGQVHICNVKLLIATYLYAQLDMKMKLMHGLLATLYLVFILRINFQGCARSIEGLRLIDIVFTKGAILKLK